MVPGSSTLLGVGGGNRIVVAERSAPVPEVESFHNDEADDHVESNAHDDPLTPLVGHVGEAKPHGQDAELDEPDGHDLTLFNNHGHFGSISTILDLLSRENVRVKIAGWEKIRLELRGNVHGNELGAIECECSEHEVVLQLKPREPADNVIALGAVVSFDLSELYNTGAA